jgi:hypothetical protein
LWFSAKKAGEIFISAAFKNLKSRGIFGCPRLFASLCYLSAPRANLDRKTNKS